MTKKLSRASELDVEKCVANVGGSRFDLILLAAARSREISSKQRDGVAEGQEYWSPAMSALLEVQSGMTGREYLKKVK